MSAKGKKWTEEQKRAWSEKCKETKCNNRWDDDRKKRHGLRMIETNKKVWTEQKRKEHSERMKKAVQDNPNSYSKNNVSGRVKMYEVKSSTGATKVKGKWELFVAEWLNNNSIRWTNDIKPIPYKWKGKWHLYFPDFHLIDLGVILEIKGYETERDRAKWDAVDHERFHVLSDFDSFDEELGTIAGYNQR